MADKLIRLPTVLALTGLSRSTLYLRIAQRRFPKPVQLGSPNIVAWLQSEVDSWINQQIRTSRPEMASLAPTEAA